MDESDTLELPPGTNIHGAVVQQRVKAGGYGTVYRARDVLSGTWLAIKLIPLQARRWAERESTISLALRHDNLVQQLGFGFWPDSEPRFIWLKMLYVEGCELDEWAWEENPDARTVVGKVLGVARGLAVVHDQGVVHRDVKEANILVRERDGEPVLLDFGAARREGQTTITEGLFPPGTPNYRSPEAWRFALEKGKERGAHYRPGTADDLYALGVVLYRLLTGRYPFEVSWEFPDSMQAVIHRVPLPPRIVNARVPEALSGVCMKLLEKDPRERPPSALALYATLEALRTHADESWQVPLQDGPRPRRRGIRDAARRRSAAEARPERPVRAPTPSTFAPATTAELPMQAMVLRALGRAVLGMAVLVGVALAGWWLAVQWKPGSQFLPMTSSTPSPTTSELPGQEVAPVWPPPDAVRAAAAPPAMQTPAVVASRVTRPKDNAVKKQPVPSIQGNMNQKESLSSMARWCASAAAVGQLACSSIPVRPTPEIQACPEGAVESMTQKLDIHIGDVQDIQLPPDSMTDFQMIPAPHEGPIAVKTLDSWANRDGMGARLNGKLPHASHLLGQLSYREGRLYGRFTEAKTPEGDTFKICMEMLDAGSRTPGHLVRDGKVSSIHKVAAVEHFE